MKAFEEELYNDEWYSDLDYVSASALADADFEHIKQLINNNAPFILSGYASLWNGDRSYKPIVVDDADTFFSKITDLDHIKVIGKFTKNKNLVTLIIYGTHHDGTNKYVLSRVKYLRKEDLKEYIISHYVNMRDEYGVTRELLYIINDDMKYYLGITLSTASKDDLVTFLRITV